MKINYYKNNLFYYDCINEQEAGFLYEHIKHNSDVNYFAFKTITGIHAKPFTKEHIQKFVEFLKDKFLFYELLYDAFIRYYYAGKSADFITVGKNNNYEIIEKNISSSNRWVLVKEKEKYKIISPELIELNI